PRGRLKAPKRRRIRSPRLPSPLVRHFHSLRESRQREARERRLDRLASLRGFGCATVPQKGSSTLIEAKQGNQVELRLLDRLERATETVPSLRGVGLTPPPVGTENERPGGA